MFDNIQRYLGFQGTKYIKPEKAGNLAGEMIQLRELAQLARQEFTQICLFFAQKHPSFQPERVSQWMNQAQVCRPHFWCYYRLPDDSKDSVALALRLFGDPHSFGISVEVSFVERKKSSATLSKQNKVLNRPINAPCYYLVQHKGVSEKMAGSEVNRQLLQQLVQTGEIRKVLVKCDILCSTEMQLAELMPRLNEAFETLLPYYEETKRL